MLPAWSTHFSREGWSYRARFDYPGVVSVYDRNTGELLVRSRPGHPTKPEAMREGRNERTR